jgi:hypothetical protein
MRRYDRLVDEFRTTHAADDDRQAPSRTILSIRSDDVLRAIAESDQRYVGTLPRSDEANVGHLNLSGDHLMGQGR